MMTAADHNPVKLMNSMRAVVLPEFGPPDVLQVQDVPMPEPGEGEVRVRVHAAFVAFGRDVSTRSGKHPVFRRLVTLPHILGGEHAGVVDKVGPGVDPTLAGKAVAVSAPVTCGDCASCQAGMPWDCSSVTAVGIQRPGSYAQYTVVPAANVDELPGELSFAHAAAYAASGPLAWEELEIAQLKEGDWVFIPGASGSVGNFLVALASRRGAHVLAATRGARAGDDLRGLGAIDVLDSNDPELSDRIREHTAGGVDAVIDNVTDAELWERYWPAVARRARVVTAGQASSTGQRLPLDVVAFYNRRATLTGLTIGDPRPIRDFWEDMRRDLLVIDPALVVKYPLNDAARAHQEIETGAKVGHIVLTVN